MKVQNNLTYVEIDGFSLTIKPNNPPNPYSFS